MKRAHDQGRRWTGSAAAALVFAAGLVAGCRARSGDPPRNDRCATCHRQEARFCRAGAHRSLDCARCHGPGEEHARAGEGPRPEMSLGGTGLCLSCHGTGEDTDPKAASRIRSFEDHLRQLERDHRITLDREKSGKNCVFCHDPHLLE